METSEAAKRPKSYVDALIIDAKCKYNCPIAVSQGYRSEAQAQAFHICHMFLKNNFADQKGPRLPKYVSKSNGRTIAWDHLQDSSVDWKLIRAEDFLCTAAGVPVKRKPGARAWLPGYEPDMAATTRCMEKYLAKYNVTKQAAPGIDHCAEPCLCGGYRSKHICQLVWDLKGLANLANILAAKRPPDDKRRSLRQVSIGIRPMEAYGSQSGKIPRTLARRTIAPAT